MLRERKLVNYTLLCFQTCSFGIKDTKENIERVAPFLSNSREPQWLGQGYYFWTDSLLFAKSWGEVHYSSKYAINKYHIVVPKNQFFDLVGNVDHQLEFLEKYEKNFYVLLDEVVNTTANEKKRKDRKSKIDKMKASGVKVSTLFWALRELKKFPYKVVKAYDSPIDSKNVKFMSGGESMLLPTRQQIVVYSEAKSMITRIEWMYPNV